VLSSKRHRKSSGAPTGTPCDSFGGFSSKIFSFSCFLMFSSFDAVAGAFPARPLVRIFLPLEVFRTLFSACVESHTRRIRCALASPTASFDCTIFKRPKRALNTPFAGVALSRRALQTSSLPLLRPRGRRLAGVTRSYPRHQCDSVNLIAYRMIECVPKTRT